ncbi:hypothetical protein A3E96_03135 [Candidatus Uhrbacteria bacterium RIFCSPHIGHO2_12_FULL_46_13]|nr:MAG: hypothetical protein A3E96_03135 [Candidatus Uhrbacteria bacterium RIFCSPHIGHO2_12_FULL_46_13]
MPDDNLPVYPAAGEDQPYLVPPSSPSYYSEPAGMSSPPPPPNRRNNFPLVLAVCIVIAVVGIAGAGYYFWGGQNLFKSPFGEPSDQPKPAPISPKPLENSAVLGNQGSMKKFASYADLKTFLEEHSGGSLPGGLFGTNMIMRGITDGGGAVPPMTLDSGDIIGESFGLGAGSSADDYSTTNIQVAGVDESDVVKNDGKYLYIASGNKVDIVDGYPPEQVRTLASIELPSMVEGLYLNDRFLAVHGRDAAIYALPAFKSLPYQRRNAPYTYLRVYDLIDRTNPKLVRDLTIQGDYIGSRMVGDYVYLITTAQGDDLDEETPVPRMFENGALLPTTPGTRCNCPEVYYFDVPYEESLMTSVMAVNMKDQGQAVAAQDYLLGVGQQLYVSPTNLYITYTSQVDYTEIYWQAMRDLLLPQLSQRAQKRIAEIEAAPNSLLSKSEKFMKIFAIASREMGEDGFFDNDDIEKELESKVKSRLREAAAEEQQTAVHRIAVSGDQIAYQASGKVPGYVLNQFSMDEHNGFFRIATTQTPSWSWFLDEVDSRNNESSIAPPRRTSSSGVYVLDQSLQVVGKVEGLGKDERIYSVRFIGERGYVVTFRQIDPFFVLDLKDPRSPAILGELKLPGFSTYLHPYDESTVIGLGRGDNGALKLSLFDVATPTSIRELNSYAFSGDIRESPALSDHKAFLFSLSKRLLVIPVTERGQNYGYGSVSFQGVVVFEVTRESGFRERGRVAHGIVESSSGSGIVGSGSDTAAVRRTRYLNDALYTVSDRFAQANRLDNLSFVKRLELSGGDFTVSPVSSYSGPERSRDAKRVSDIKQIQTAFELYFQDTNGYPVKGTKTASIVLGSPGNTAIVHNSVIYMGRVPSNPSPGGAPYRYHSTDGKENDCTSAPCAGYEIIFTLEGQTGSLSAGERTATPNGIK